MSESADARLEGEGNRLSKTERRLKKTKADKQPQPLESESEESVRDDIKASKKRKREILPDEIEIDVSLPEPASKKAARKAKKAKTQPPATSGADNMEAGDKSQENPDGKQQAGKRSEYSVWIGNLPWSANKDLLRAFLTDNSDINTEDITRIHMPVPKAPPRPNWHDAKPQNKGFAYVDFATQLAMYSAIALTETRMDNRPLLIKNSKNFEGRPDKPKEQEQEGQAAKGKDIKSPSRKIFVGNLGFETSKEDLEAHFSQCGTVESTHMATFEDTGKCKGFAWVTFENVEAATAAVKGYVYKTEGKSEKKDGSENEYDHEGVVEQGKNKKYRLNKLLGRDLRCEFAEDSTTRYQKRFGKEKKPDDDAGEGEEGGYQQSHRGKKPFVPRNKFHNHDRKVDPRTIRPGAAHTNAPRASAAIVESKGTKITFD